MLRRWQAEHRIYRPTATVDIADAVARFCTFVVRHQYLDVKDSAGGDPNTGKSTVPKIEVLFTNKYNQGTLARRLVYENCHAPVMRNL